MNGCMLLALCFDKGLTLKTSTIETFYSRQFTLSTHLIKLNYFVTPPTDRALYFLYELTLLWNGYVNPKNYHAY